jgi:hypothetical protein
MKLTFTIISKSGQDEIVRNIASRFAIPAAVTQHPQSGIM